MKTSEMYGRLSGLARVAALAAAAMIVISSIYYLFSGDGNTAVASTPGSSHWLILSGYGWMVVTGLCAAASFIFSKLASETRKAETQQAADARSSEQAARARETEAQNYSRRQAELNNQINNANLTAARLLDSLPNHLEEATRHLRQAEIDWRERVFNPFWTSIESCACSLAEFKRAIEGIAASAQQYRAASSEIAGPVPPFSVTGISVESMNAYSKINDFMAKFTRRAQGDRDFANIFELWRGNAIMERGFANLQSAIQRMSMDISSQISSLHYSLDEMSRSIDHQTSRVTGAVADHTAMSGMHYADMQRTLEASQRHEKTIANRLWNIERGYKPLF